MCWQFFFLSLLEQVAFFSKYIFEGLSPWRWVNYEVTGPHWPYFCPLIFLPSRSFFRRPCHFYWLCHFFVVMLFFADMSWLCCRWFSLPLLENCPICRPWGENFAQNVFPGKLLLPALPPLLSCAASPWQLNKVEGSAPHCSGPLPNDDQRYQLQLQRFQGWSKISTPKISRMIKDINSNSKDYKDDINSKFKDYKE